MVIKQIGERVIQRRLAKGESPLDITISMYEQAAVMLANGLNVDADTLLWDPICDSVDDNRCPDDCVLGTRGICTQMAAIHLHDAKRPEEIKEVVRALKKLKEVKQDETVRP